jgi:hypothetical protein
MENQRREKIDNMKMLIKREGGRLVIFESVKIYFKREFQDGS